MNLATSAVSPAAFVVLKYLLDFFGELSKFEEKTRHVSSASLVFFLSKCILRCVEHRICCDVLTSTALPPTLTACHYVLTTLGCRDGNTSISAF